MPMYLIFSFVVIILSLAFAWTWFSAGPFTPIPSTILKRLLNELYLEPGHTFYDLGAGDGRVLIMAAHQHGQKAIGYELHPLVWLVARIRIALAGRSDSINLYLGDLFKTDLHDADVVYTHLLRHGLDKLEAKMLTEMTDGSRIISYGAPLKSVQPSQEINLSGDHPSWGLFPLIAYVYKIKK